jgi:hypothetical protein
MYCLHQVKTIRTGPRANPFEKKHRRARYVPTIFICDDRCTTLLGDLFDRKYPTSSLTVQHRPSDLVEGRQRLESPRVPAFDARAFTIRGKFRYGRAVAKCSCTDCMAVGETLMSN